MNELLEDSMDVKRAMEEGEDSWWFFDTPDYELEIPNNLRNAFKRATNEEITRLENEIEKLKK